MPADHSTARMSPRERILAALAHRQPDRVPFSWGFGTTGEMGRIMEAYLREPGLDWGRLRAAVNDKAGAGPEFVGPQPPGGNTFSGIWGIKLKTAEYEGGSYQEFTDFPLAGVESPAELDEYPWPDPDWFVYDSIRKRVLQNDPERQRAVQVPAGNPFEIYSWMTGIEEALVNLLVNPELVTSALAHITDFFEEKLRRTLAAGADVIDLVFMADDLGGQNGLLMSLDTYRAVVKPFHRRLAACVHTHAPHAKCMHHSDGAVFDVLPDLIDAGVDVLEAVQTDAAGMEPERLKRAFGDRLSFHGAISVQQLLPHSDADTVRAECRRLVQVLGEGGGYIAAPAHAIQVGTPPENVLAMLEAVLGEEDYQQAIEQARIG